MKSIFRFTQRKSQGATLIEVIITLVIIAILAGIFIATLIGLKSRDRIDRAITAVKSDIMIIRSRSISTNSQHRINFTSSSEWIVQQWDEDTSAWVKLGGTRSLPVDTNLTGDTFTNAADNLEASSRGLFEFADGAIGDPYITVTSLGDSRVKSLYVAVGGAIEVRYE